MSKNNSNGLELTSIPRNASANRFQVNLVQNNANGDTTVEAHEVDDVFDENDVELRPKQRRTSKIQQVIRSSLKGSDSSKKERKESIARFKVSDDNSDDEDENLLDGNEYDTKYGRSLRQYFIIFYNNSIYFTDKKHRRFIYPDI